MRNPVVAVSLITDEFCVKIQHSKHTSDYEHN
jgi:hypothetical protein